LTPEQAQVVAQAQQSVQVCDSNGNVLGHIEPIGFTQEEIAEAKRRLASDQPRYTSQQVLAHLRALEEEWERTGGFDSAYLHAFLDRLRAGEAR
jgi:hypothetical protein